MQGLAGLWVPAPWRGRAGRRLQGLGGGGGRTRGGTGGPGGTVASPQWQRAAPASRCLNFLSGCSSEHFNVSENQRAAADLSLEGLPPPRLLRLSPRGDGRVWQPARATRAGGGSVGSPPLCPGSRWGRGECPRLCVGSCSPGGLGCWPDWLQDGGPRTPSGEPSGVKPSGRAVTGSRRGSAHTQ